MPDRKSGHETLAPLRQDISVVVPIPPVLLTADGLDVSLKNLPVPVLSTEHTKAAVAETEKSRTDPVVRNTDRATIHSSSGSDSDRLSETAEIGGIQSGSSHFPAADSATDPTEAAGSITATGPTEVTEQAAATDTTAARPATAGAKTADGSRIETARCKPGTGGAAADLSASKSIASNRAETEPQSAQQSDRFDDVIRASVGDTIQISLPDHAWIYDRMNSSTAGLEFVDIQYLQTSKEFVFNASEQGDAILVFHKQDLTNATSSTSRIKVEVGKTSLQQDITASLDSGTAGVPKTVGREPFSVESLLREVSEKDLNGVEKQLKLFNNRMYGEGSVSGMGPGQDEEYAADGEYGSGDKSGAGQQRLWRSILDAAVSLEGSPFERTAEKSLYLYLETANDTELLAEVYYLLGRYYESPPLPRDESVAVGYYQKVMEIFPTNIYYFRAEERIKYLKRHFLQIR